MKKANPFLIIALVSSPLFSQQYSWPLELGKAITSNFGEVRPRRFHAGLDIPTNGTTGHEIFAAADGHVWRIKVSSSGYGKVLYLKLKDGRTAVYGHLDDFSPLLSDIVKLEQERQNSYAVERYFPPDKIPIRKGDLIGFSGESGYAFGPHLHFELRDSAQYPLNPLLEGFSLPDRRRPVARGLAVVPLSLDAIVNGSPLPQILPLRMIESGDYEFPDTIHVFGTVGVEISAIDRITALPGEFNIYGASLSVDGVENYRIEFNKFPFHQSQLVEVERDNSFRRLNDGDFHRLFVTKGSDPLTFITENSQGRLRLDPGHHRISITIFDHAKNVARISGIVYFAPPIRIKTSVLNETSETVTIRVEPDGSPFPITDIAVYSFNEKGYVEQTVDPVSLRRETKGLVAVLPRNHIRRRILQIIGIDRFGAVSHPDHIPIRIGKAGAMEARIDLSVTHLEQSVIFQVESRSLLSTLPEVILRQSDGERLLQMRQMRPTTFMSTPLHPADLGDVNEVGVLVHGSPTREVRFQFRPRLAVPENSSAAISPDKKCSLQAIPTSFYDTTAFWVEEVTEPVPVEGGQLISDAYQLQPFDRPLMDSARVAIAMSKSQEGPDNKGIFYYDRKRGWTYLPSRFSRTKWAFYCSLFSLESVAIIEDLTKPIIRDLFPGDGGRYRIEDVETISATVKDDLAGIEGDGSIEMYLDGKRLLFEYFPIKKSVRYRLDELLEPGKHTLSITASDQVGNLSSETAEFSVN